MRIDLSQLDFIDPFLRDILIHVESYFGVDFTITSLYRIDDDGVHGQLPLRGIDLRCWGKEMGEAVEDYVNDRYVYDLSRSKMKVCVFHDVGRGAHLHFQTLPNATQLRK